MSADVNNGNNNGLVLLCSQVCPALVEVGSLP